MIYPLNPYNFWSMQSSVDAVGVRTLMPNNALATLMALTPKDINIEYLYCDENISKIDFNMKCDLVAMTGYTLHSARMKEISAKFRARGIPIALGGPYATLNQDEASSFADHVFIHEAEYTWPQFLRDFINGDAKPVYIQSTFIDMKDSPAPDFSKINGKDYLYFSVQTSRGCPNNCDFCDAIRLVGRQYRTKSIDQVMTEIKNAHAAGAETIFFSEDNFFVKKSYTKELLEEIIKWNTNLKQPVSFSAQTTIRIGTDEEILKLLADARFSVFFLGVESINKECLKEINKSHILQYDPVQSIMKMSSYGLLPFIGLIVGFDNDSKGTFTDIENYLNYTGSPFASISILNAPENTRLYERMHHKGRILENFKGYWHFSTNIVPITMGMDELLNSHRILFQKIYEPKNFEERTLKWLSNITYFSPIYYNRKIGFSRIVKLVNITLFYMLHEPKEVRQLYFRLLKKTWKLNPKLFKKAVTIMSQYCHYYDYSHNAEWISHQ